MLTLTSLDRLDGIVQKVLENLVPPGTEVAFEVTEDGVRNVGVGPQQSALPDRPRASLAGVVKAWAAQAHQTFGAAFVLSARHIIEPGASYNDPVNLPDFAFIHIALMKRGDPRVSMTQSTVTIRPSADKPVAANEALNSYVKLLYAERPDWFEGMTLLQIFTGTRQGLWSGADQTLLTRLYDNVLATWPGPPRKPR
jgi:hypothetical protein